MKDFLKKNYKEIIFFFVLGLAVFLRVWHFSDWLFFKMDQARDAMLIRDAFEKGPGWLPLLGPKAGGTELNVGPVFYYFQYLAAAIFQSTHPAVMAFPDLLFGILSIPLFYIFAKKYFSRDWSLVLAGLYSVCFLGIQYSRFAWNPNSLSFFNLLYFYSLLNVFDSPRTTESRQGLLNKNTAASSEESVVRGKKIKYRLRWVILAGASFAVSTQLHFLSFLTLPVITAIFLWKNRKDAGKFLDWKKVVIFVFVVLLFYLPVFLNEVISKGENTREFISALKEKPSAHSFWQNVKRDIRYFGQNWFLILTSWISRKTGIKGAIVSWLGAILPALFFGFKFYRREENSGRKNFILVSLLWFLVYFLAYIPIAYQIRPRFFLPLLALPFIFVGYLAVFFWEKRRIFWKICVVLALSIMFFGNLTGTYFWFKEIRSSQKRVVYPKRTIILKAQDGIVLWHLEKASEYIKRDCDKPLIFISASSEYKSPAKYVLALANLNAVSIKNYDGGQDGCFYAFGLTRSKNFSLKNKEKFDILSQNKFGALTVYKINPKEDAGAFFAGEKEEKSKRIFWKDIFGISLEK